VPSSERLSSSNTATTTTAAAMTIASQGRIRCRAASASGITPVSF
jgi:hypothetical protein